MRLISSSSTRNSSRKIENSMTCGRHSINHLFSSIFELRITAIIHSTLVHSSSSFSLLSILCVFLGRRTTNFLHQYQYLFPRNDLALATHLHAFTTEEKKDIPLFPPLLFPLFSFFLPFRNFPFSWDLAHI